MSGNNAASGKGTQMALAGIDFSNYSDKELTLLFQQALSRKIHGISFSPISPGSALVQKYQRSKFVIDWSSFNRALAG